MRSKLVGDVQKISPRRERPRVSLNQLLMTTPLVKPFLFIHQAGVVMATPAFL
ncbi:MAG TPA: hypothetical protein V6D26_30080 [Stenomitos sp.]